jgi:membrane-bound metal-dependent hydrolase YbcI (DUF457 family)
MVTRQVNPEGIFFRMPFTPYHMGFGLIIKSAKPTKISFIMYGFSQIAIDAQQLYKHMAERAVTHGITHTILGATVIGFACLPFRSLMGLIFKKEITISSAVYGVFIGVYSHLVLDSIVHIDVSKNLFRPFNFDSHLFGLLSIEGMNRLCILLGLIGIIKS